MKLHSVPRFFLFATIFWSQLLFATGQLCAQENSADTLKLLGNFQTEQELEKSIQSFNQQGIETVVKTQTKTDSYFRLEFGPFPLKRDALEWLVPLQKKGFDAKLIERNFDFVIELGKFTDQAELQKTSQRAKSLGYSLLKEVPIETTTVSWDLYQKSSSPKTALPEPILPKPTRQGPVKKTLSKVDQVIRDTKSVANYASRQEALDTAKRINRDKSSRAFVLRKKRNVIAYFLGPYSSKVQADTIVDKLQNDNIKHKLEWDKNKLAYIISILEVDNKTSKNKIYNQLVALGIGEPRRKFVTRINYEVVMQPRQQKPSQIVVAKNTGTKAPKAVQQNIINNAKQKTVLTTLSDSRAQQKVIELERKGITSDVQQQIEDVTLEALLLTNINSWNQARQIAKKLKQQGIDAFPISNRHNKNFSVSVGYSVSVGVYQDRENIKNQLKKVRELGYNNAEIVGFQKQITSYKVIADKPKPSLNEQGDIIDSDEDEAGSPLFDETDDEEMLVFLDTDSLSSGEGSNSFTSYYSEDNIYQFALESLSSSYNLQPDRSEVDTIFTTRVKAYATAKFNSEWDAKLSLGIKYWSQQGLLEVDNTEVLLDNAFVRYRAADYRVTVGNQAVLWGRLDGDAPTDMMSTRDLSFLVLDSDLDAQRISDTSIRVEGYYEQFKLDFLLTPKPHATLVPEENSSWAFINRSTGRILGVEPLPIIEALAINGTIEETQAGETSWGLRLSHTGEKLDYAITAQQTRIPTPFYSINPEILFLLFSGNTVEDAINLTQGDTFLVYQPETTVIGGDFGWVEGASTVRGEIAWISDYPVIRESTLQFDTSAAVTWGVGLETYPEGVEDTRIIVQVVGTQILDSEDTLGDLSTLSLNGQLETFFLRDRWRMRVNFLASLNKKDFYINPEISYNGFSNQEIFLGFHFFQGDDDTLGGFFENSDTISLGWRGTFN